MNLIKNDVNTMISEVDGVFPEEKKEFPSINGSNEDGAIATVD